MCLEKMGCEHFTVGREGRGCIIAIISLRRPPLSCSWNGADLCADCGDGGRPAPPPRFLKSWDDLASIAGWPCLLRLPSRRLTSEVTWEPPSIAYRSDCLSVPTAACSLVTNFLSVVGRGDNYAVSFLHHCLLRRSIDQSSAQVPKE